MREGILYHISSRPQTWISGWGDLQQAVHYPLPLPYKPESLMHWDHLQPYTVTVSVKPADIDALGHANNTAYVRWMEQCAWQHSAALGLDITHYHSLDRAMIVLKHALHYLAAAYEGEELVVATWIIKSDGKLRLTRHFQIVRSQDATTLLRAQSEYVCIEISSGKPKKMPIAFIEGYGQGLLP